MSDNKRKAPFTAFERDFLKELVGERIQVIESKKTDAENSSKKSIAWKAICHKFNLHPQCQPVTVRQLRKLWLNMKWKAREAVKQQCHTEGGLYNPDPAPEDDAVAVDSNGSGDLNSDDDDVCWLSIKKRKVDNKESTETYSENIHIKLEEDPLDSVNTTHNITSSAEVNSYAATCNGITTSNPNCSKRIVISPAIPAPNISLNEKKNTITAPNIYTLKCKLIEEDIKHRELKFQLELAHQKRMYELERNILLLEYEHKKRLFNLIEEKQKMCNELP